MEIKPKFVLSIQ